MQLWHFGGEGEGADDPCRRVSLFKLPNPAISETVYSSGNSEIDSQSCRLAWWTVQSLPKFLDGLSIFNISRRAFHHNGYPAIPEKMSDAKSPKAKKAKSTPTAVAEFTILPLALPTQSGLPSSCADAKHYLYVKAHNPAQSIESTPRSLFIANVPIDATEANLRALFAEHLGGARVESVAFDASIPAVVEHKRFKPEQLKDGKKQDSQANRGTKRKSEDEKDGKTGKKEIVAEGLVEDDESALPRIWNGEIRRSGSGAVVVFLDRASMKGALLGVQKAVKEGKTVPWIGGTALGVERESTSPLIHFVAKRILILSFQATNLTSPSSTQPPPSLPPQQTPTSRNSTLHKISAIVLLHTCAPFQTKMASSP